MTALLWTQRLVVAFSGVDFFRKYGSNFGGRGELRETCGGRAMRCFQEFPMPAIVEFPDIVNEALERFGDLFAGEPQRRHFAEYLTGLFIAGSKTVAGINREFADTTDQSCLNRFLTEANWDVEAINNRRLELLQEDDATRYCEDGVIALDNVLIDHDGKRIEDVGWFWDHAEDRHKIAHDYLIANYVCPSGLHYPLHFRRFVKRDQCAIRGERFTDHTELFMQLVDFVCNQQIPGVFAFDSFFTNAKILNYIHERRDHHGQPRGYVGDLKVNRKIWYRGRELNVSDFAATIAPDHRREQRRGDSRQWSFTCTVHIPGVNHKVRIVILWKHRRDTEPCKILVTNRLTWDVRRILRAYEQRWTGTETFHRDGKQELGMGDCQLRDGQGQTRHMHLVMLAYSLLVRQLRHGRALHWSLHKLTTSAKPAAQSCAKRCGRPLPGPSNKSPKNLKNSTMSTQIWA
jgi:hypothetical protein